MNTDAVFAPGTSPFRTKGNVYRALFESADARVPGGRAAVLARIEDPELLAFYDQTFLAASTYDILPIVPFGMAGAKIVDLPYAEFVRGGAEFSGLPRPLALWPSPRRSSARKSG